MRRSGRGEVALERRPLGTREETAEGGRRGRSEAPTSGVRVVRASRAVRRGSFDRASRSVARAFPTPETVSNRLFRIIDGSRTRKKKKGRVESKKSGPLSTNERAPFRPANDASLAFGSRFGPRALQRTRERRSGTRRDAASARRGPAGFILKPSARAAAPAYPHSHHHPPKRCPPSPPSSAASSRAPRSPPRARPSRPAPPSSPPR